MKPTGYKPMVVLFFLFLIQQFSGIYITLFYAVTYFEVSVVFYRRIFHLSVDIRKR